MNDYANIFQTCGYTPESIPLPETDGQSTLQQALTYPSLDFQQFDMNDFPFESQSSDLHSNDNFQRYQNASQTPAASYVFQSSPEIFHPSNANYELNLRSDELPVPEHHEHRLTREEYRPLTDLNGYPPSGSLAMNTYSQGHAGTALNPFNPQAEYQHQDLEDQSGQAWASTPEGCLQSDRYSNEGGELPEAPALGYLWHNIELTSSAVQASRTHISPVGSRSSMPERGGYASGSQHLGNLHDSFNPMLAGVGFVADKELREFAVQAQQVDPIQGLPILHAQARHNATWYPDQSGSYWNPIDSVYQTGAARQSYMQANRLLSPEETSRGHVYRAPTTSDEHKTESPSTLKGSQGFTANDSSTGPAWDGSGKATPPFQHIAPKGGKGASHHESKSTHSTPLCEEPRNETGSARPRKRKFNENEKADIARKRREKSVCGPCRDGHRKASAREI